MDDTAPVSSRTRGRTDKIGEGRATGSRSSSTDSDASAVRFELFRQDYGLNDYAQHNISSSHSQADYSEDEYATSVSQLSAAEDAPVIRPPIGFQFGQNQTQGLFGFGAFSQFGPNHANGFYAPSEQPSGSLPSSGLSLPSKVYGNGPAAAFGPLTEQSTIAAQESVAGWNGFNIPGQPSFNMFGLGAGSQNGNGTNMFAQNAMQQATGAFPLNEVPSFQGNLLGEHHQASLEHTQNAAGGAVPQHTSQNANDAMTSASHPVSTTDDGASPDYRAIVESFFASVSNAHPEAENLPDSNAPPSQPVPESTTDRTESVPEATPTLRRTVSNESHEPSSGPTSDDDASSDSSFASQKKRDKQTEQANGGAKSDEQRKRGMFRVRTSPASPSSQSERPVFTPPKQPLFSASGPVSSTETPLPYFEYKQRKESSKQTTSTNGAQRDSGPSKTTTPVNSGNTTTGTQTRESSCEPSSVNLSISEASASRDEPRPIATQNNAGPPLPSQILPSAISYASSSAPSPSSQSIGGTPFQGPSLKMHYESEAILAERETPPENHLVSVMIADKRFPNTEPVLVELILPLSPSGKSDYWLDTMFFCHSLQSGPSRIDGPAKAFVFRGRFRQYFLRVSEQNMDNYASGNIVVPYNRFLNVTVESTVPQVPPVCQTTSLPAPVPVLPLVPSSYANLTHIASPNPSEASRPSAPVARSVQPPKRPREHSPPSSAPESAAPTSATPSNGQQSSTSNQEPPRKSYYRKRAL
ncbi:hypothetical protein ACEPAH_6737 [Sanghuangporus vaninii]